jgi:hypothetical protein
MPIFVYRRLSNFSAIVKALSSIDLYTVLEIKFTYIFVVPSSLLYMYFQQPCFHAVVCYKFIIWPKGEG